MLRLGIRITIKTNGLYVKFYEEDPLWAEEMGCIRDSDGSVNND